MGRTLIHLCCLVFASCAACALPGDGVAETQAVQEPLQETTRQFPQAPLLTVGQVHKLTPAQAREHRPVTLRGVVSAFSGWRDYFFLQDATGGIAINREEHLPIHAGDRLELTGVSDPGLFANSVISSKLRIVGQSEMPRVPLSSYSDLEGGGKDATWVRVRGVVRSARMESIWDKPVLVLNVEIGGGTIAVRVFQFKPGAGERLVDAVVQVAGVCGTAYNDKRQFEGLRLFVPTIGAIEVDEPAPVDPYAGPASPIRTVMQFRPNGRARHRVKIVGTVTYQDSGHSLYIQDGTDGIMLETTEDQSLAVGTRIEALGFPAVRSDSPTLTDASFRIVGRGIVGRGIVGRGIVGRGTIVEPASIHAADFLAYKDTFSYAPYDGQLVHLRGTVVSPLALPNEDAWLMRDGESNFVASLRRAGSKSAPLKIANGTTIGVTGVMSVTVNADHQPRSFRILLRDSEDLAILKQASWWTPLHLFGVVALLLVTVLATVLWTILLRRQVKQQTELLRESEGRFRKQAEQDTLTGLASRVFLHQELETAIGRAHQTSALFGLLMLDLDHFKQVNDTLGHHAGDELLCIVASRIRATVRRSDIVARMGGDEFVVLLNDLGHASEAAAIGAKVVASVAIPAEIAGQPRTVSASVGVCTYPDAGSDGKTLLQHVDEAMYKAKAAGRNNSCVYTSAR